MTEPQILYTSDRTGEDPSRFVVMEYPPMRVPASLKVSDEIFQLWTPYLISMVRPKHLTMSLWARPRPATAKDNMVYLLGWPHIAGHGGVCYAPRNFIDQYPRESEDPMERDRLTAIACMQIFLNGDSSYFICSAADLPLEMRPTNKTVLPHSWSKKDHEPYGGAHARGYGSVADYFHAWEKMSKEEVLSLHYVEYEKLTYIIRHQLSYSPERIMRERAVLHHLEDEVSHEAHGS